MRRKPLLWLRSVLLPLLRSQPLHRKPLKRLLPLRQRHKRLKQNRLTAVRPLTAFAERPLR